MSDQRSNPGLSKQLSRKSVDLKSQNSRADDRGQSFKNNAYSGGGADQNFNSYDNSNINRQISNQDQPPNMSQGLSHADLKSAHKAEIQSSKAAIKEKYNTLDQS